MTAEKHSHIITVTGASLLLVQIATLELIKKEKNNTQRNKQRLLDFAKGGILADHLIRPYSYTNSHKN